MSDDTVHQPIGQGSFPDNYYEQRQAAGRTTTLPEMPGRRAGGPIDTTNQDTILHSTLALTMPSRLIFRKTSVRGWSTEDHCQSNRFTARLSIQRSGKRWRVVYHEGTHSIFTPLVGSQAPGGGALNELKPISGPNTITDAEAIGEYDSSRRPASELIPQAGRDQTLCLDSFGPHQP